MTELPTDLLDLAKTVIAAAKTAGCKITTAESCTGGLIGGCITAIPGSSAVYEGGFVTYSNEAKSRLLGVPRDAIAEFGAVSDIVAAAMAEGAMAQTDADFAIAVTGIAGPDGGTKEKPVGLVFLAVARRDADALVKRYIFAGTRTDIRRATVAAAMELLRGQIDAAAEDADQEPAP
jgi:nicotinamide-nucleotide amidase